MGQQIGETLCFLWTHAVRCWVMFELLLRSTESVQKSLERSFGQEKGKIQITPSEEFLARMGVSAISIILGRKRPGLVVWLGEVTWSNDLVRLAYSLVG